ncbi:MAG: LysR family transcriptional regulator [Rubrivivax sp.]|nr:LysR family transcriptional regulator [Rubrivivax sp.]
MNGIDRSRAGASPAASGVSGTSAPATRPDYLELDGHLLQLLLAVAEEGSVTRAAERLAVTQSAVSHGLARLRRITGDELFVKSGRGIAPTALAGLLAERARRLLDDLRAFGRAAGFEPARLVETFTIAANDLQRDLLLPALLRRLRAAAPGVTMRIVPSNAPTPSLLRDEGCHLVVTPRPPQGSDIVQRRLFEDRHVVFHDPAFAPPNTREAWLAAEHVTVLYEGRRGLHFDEWLHGDGLQRRVVATVPGMAALASLVRGGPWLATAPSLLAEGALRGLGMAELPFAAPPLRMYAVWHMRHQADPVMRWLRDELDAVVADVLARAARPVPPRLPRNGLAAAPPPVARRARPAAKPPNQKETRRP